MENYMKELLADGNVTIAASDRGQFLSACALRGIDVVNTDACDYDGESYERYDVVARP